MLWIGILTLTTSFESKLYFSYVVNRKKAGIFFLNKFHQAVVYKFCVYLHYLYQRNLGGCRALDPAFGRSVSVRDPT